MSTSPSPGPRILVCGWAGAGNIGDELLVRAVAAQLHEAGARVVVASRDPEATRALHPDVEAVPWGVRGLRHMGQVDGVCIGPGGILQDSSSYWSLPGHLAMPWRARRNGAVIAAIGVGAEPIRRRSSATLLRRVLAGATVVTRDPQSSAALGVVGIHSETGTDVVFGLNPPAEPTRAEIVVSVGPTTRPGRVAPAARRLEPAPIAEIAAALDRLAADLHCRVVLSRFRGRRDHEAARDLASRIEAETEILGDDVDEHVRRVSAARVVVSSRYHPIVLAASAGVPVLAVSGQSKVVSLVAEIDDPSVRLVRAWADIGGTEGVSEGGEPVVPEGLDAAHRALRDLVRSAGAPRGDHRGG